MRETALITCVDTMWGIGLQGRIPWRNKTDMKFFREKTMGNVCIMGRKTYNDIVAAKKESNKPMCGPLLDGRISIIISTTLKDINVPQGFVFSSVVDAIDFIKDKYNKLNVYFIGGRSIYVDSFVYINKAYVNMLNYNYNCDTIFPNQLLNILKLDKTNELDETVTSFEYSGIKLCY